MSIKKTYSYMRFPEGKSKAITLSYDDGVTEDIRFVELMKQYGFKGTFNLNYNRISEKPVYLPGKKHRRMTAEEIRATYDPDHTEIACHSYNHRSLALIPTSEVLYEIAEDRRGWEEFAGKIIRGFAYANGSFNDDAVECLRLAGIAYARTTLQTEGFDLPKDWLRLESTCRHRNPRLMELAEEFAEMKVDKEPKWFYLWGHTYEFEDDNNWEMIENFFRRMSGLEDVWYATNIEIYDYIKAYEKLEYSADGNWVYNPTSVDLWMTNAGADLCIPAGQIVEL